MELYLRIQESFFPLYHNFLVLHRVCMLFGILLVLLLTSDSDSTDGASG